LKHTKQEKSSSSYISLTDLEKQLVVSQKKFNWFMKISNFVQVFKNDPTNFDNGLSNSSMGINILEVIPND
jgi:hypothetical protein